MSNTIQVQEEDSNKRHFDLVFSNPIYKGVWDQYIIIICYAKYYSVEDYECEINSTLSTVNPPR